MDNLSAFEKIIGYRFKDKSLLKTALTHSSYVNENKGSHCDDNERLEFFGDAIIEFFVSEHLFNKHKSSKEGDLTKTRASMVCEPSLALCARKIKLGEHLFMGRGEEASGGRERDSITSDAFEALVAAIFLDGGEKASNRFLFEFLLKPLENEDLFFDAKTKLQEKIQKIDGAVLRYEMVGEEGPSHAKVFEAAVFFNDKEIGRGKGHSKKAAQQQAAEEALDHLRSS